MLAHFLKSDAFMLGRPLTLALLRTSQVQVLQTRLSVRIGIASSGIVYGLIGGGVRWNGVGAALEDAAPSDGAAPPAEWQPSGSGSCR